MVLVLLISCPNCGPRNGSEFTWHGPPKARPDATTTTKQQWRQYLYEEANVAGWVTERWTHRAGCRDHLMIDRHTVTNEIRSVERLGSGVNE